MSRRVGDKELEQLETLDIIKSISKKLPTANAKMKEKPMTEQPKEKAYGKDSINMHLQPKAETPVNDITEDSNIVNPVDMDSPDWLPKIETNIPCPCSHKEITDRRVNHLKKMSIGHSIFLPLYQETKWRRAIYILQKQPGYSHYKFTFRKVDELNTRAWREA